MVVPFQLVHPPSCRKRNTGFVLASNKNVKWSALVPVLTPSLCSASRSVSRSCQKHRSEEDSGQACTSKAQTIAQVSGIRAYCQSGGCRESAQPEPKGQEEAPWFDFQRVDGPGAVANDPTPRTSGIAGGLNLNYI